MKTIIFGGKKVDVCEHMSEIKAKTDYFNRFFNRKQMLKYYLHNFVICQDGVEYTDEHTPDGRFGIASGRRITLEGRDRSDDECVSFIKIEDIRSDAIDDCLFFLEFMPDKGFFIEANDGQIYLVCIEED